MAEADTDGFPEFGLPWGSFGSPISLGEWACRSCCEPVFIGVASDALIRRRAFVSGLVQGVGFRAAAAREARRLRVTGYAANLADGRVEVLACGSRHAVLTLVEWLQEGPAQARVRSVQVEEVVEGFETPTHFAVR